MVIKCVGGHGLIDMEIFKLIRKGSYALEKNPLLSRLSPCVFNIYLEIFKTT